MPDSEIEIEEYLKHVEPKNDKKVKDKTKKSIFKPKEKKQNPWIKHVQEYKKNHPELKYSECLKQAKLTYKKN